MALSYITQGSIFLCPRTYCYWDTAATASKHNQNKKIELQVQKKNLKNNNQHRTEIPPSKKKQVFVRILPMRSRIAELKV